MGAVLSVCDNFLTPGTPVDPFQWDPEITKKA